MTSCLSLVPRRGLRKWLDDSVRYRPPIPNYRKRHGIHKTSERVLGFEYYEQKDIPQHYVRPKQRGARGDMSYSVSPKFNQNNHPELRGYTHVQPQGYEHPVTGEWIDVEDMVPEIVVPDGNYFNSKLKPYVSYKADEEMELREAEEGRHISQPLTAETLFDAFYREKVESAFKSGKYDGAERFSVFDTEETAAKDDKR